MRPTLILFFALLFGCSQKKVENFVGKWNSVSDGHQIEIYKEGELYILNKSTDNKLVFKSSGTSLLGSGIYGDVTFSENNGHIYFAGTEYESKKERDVRVLVKYADRIQCKVVYKYKGQNVGEVSLSRDPNEVPKVTLALPSSVDLSDDANFSLTVSFNLPNQYINTTLWHSVTTIGTDIRRPGNVFPESVKETYFESNIYLIKGCNGLVATVFADVSQREGKQVLSEVAQFYIPKYCD